MHHCNSAEGESVKPMKKNNKTRIIIALTSIIVLIALFFGLYKAFGPKPVSGSKAYTVTVTDKDQAVKTYEGRTDAEYLSDLMDELKAAGDFTYEGSMGEYGLFIESINGLKADYNTDGAYWAIYVNGAYGEYGADAQPVEDGGQYGFVYETY